MARTQREFIHVDDVVEGMLFLVERLDDPRTIAEYRALRAGQRSPPESVAA